jgi:hypothetical protein
MNLSWIANRSLKLSPRVRLVADDEAAALQRKLESLAWKPSSGFLKDQLTARPRAPETRSARAA